MEWQITGGGGVRIAARDSGGDQPAILLLHGAGRSLADWYALQDACHGRYRLVSFDLRNHGLSGDGDWSWDLALADVRAVLAATDVPVVAAVGHSLGGLLALMAVREGLVPTAVNLDGFAGRGWEAWSDEDPERIRADAAALVEYRGALVRAMAAGVEASQLAEVHQALVASAGTSGIQIPPLEVVSRCFPLDADGWATPRPALEADLAMRQALDELDLARLLRAAPGRAVVVRGVAHQGDPTAPAAVQRYAVAMQSAMGRLLAELAHEGATKVVEWKADHSLHVTHADAVVNLLDELVLEG